MDDSLAKFRAAWAEARAAEEAAQAELVAACDYETKLAVTAWVFRALNEHMRQGGTFRYLIYDRLGFNSREYVTLYSAGGMNLSNALQPTEDGR